MLKPRVSISGIQAFAIALILILPGCSGQAAQDAPAIKTARKTSVQSVTGKEMGRFIEFPVPQRFTICHGHTCARYAEVSLSAEEWKQIAELFNPRPASADAELIVIQDAIAVMERMVGEKTGTDKDRGGNRRGLGLPGQMDCIDESTNTTVYLTMMQNKGLITWHGVDHRSTRGVFMLKPGYPHSTAVLRQRSGSDRYAVDSWFLDNGEQPFVVPLDEWKSGWVPSGT
jgi:hypothetical protein